MKTRNNLTLLTALMLLFGVAYAESVSPALSYGLEGGIAKGDNAGSSELWVPMIGAHLQLRMARNILVRGGLSYAQLKARASDDEIVYNTKTLQGDIRMLFRPLQMDIMSPYIYLGFGAAKDMHVNRADFVPVVPFGLGFHSKLNEHFLLDLKGGYTLALSDKMDGRRRPDHQMNRYTNSKHDGYFNVMLGIVLIRSQVPKTQDFNTQAGSQDYYENMQWPQTRTLSDGYQTPPPEMETEEAVENGSSKAIIEDNVHSNGPNVGVLSDQYRRSFSLKRAHAAKDWQTTQPITHFGIRAIDKCGARLYASYDILDSPDKGITTESPLGNE